MANFVKLDGKWFNPEHVAAVTTSASARGGFSRVMMSDGTVFAVGLATDVIVVSLIAGS